MSEFIISPVAVKKHGEDIEKLQDGVALTAVKSGNNWILPSGTNASAGQYVEVNGVLGTVKKGQSITGGSTIINSTVWETCKSKSGAINMLSAQIVTLPGVANDANAYSNILNAVKTYIVNKNVEHVLFSCPITGLRIITGVASKWADGNTIVGSLTGASSIFKTFTISTNSNDQYIRDPYEVKTYTITKDTTKISSGTITCKVINNIAHVNIYNVVFKSTGNSQNVASGFPKALVQGQMQFAGSTAANNAAIVAAGEICWIGENTTALCVHLNGKQALGHYCSFSYPVA